MPAKLILGLQWGDEGKGKIIDCLAGNVDVVVRFQGGANAGHTVVIGEEEFALHTIPSGILHPEKRCVVGNGLVLDPAQLIQEIQKLESRGIDVRDRLSISERVHVVFPYHKVIDEIREGSRGDKKIGTTKRGIGPTYGDKATRVGMRMADLFDDDHFRESLKANVDWVNRFWTQPYQYPELDWKDIYESYRGYAQNLKPMVKDTVYELNDMYRGGKNILLEGAQGALLDIDFGTYPYVTSSNIVGSAHSGTGLPLGCITDICGVLKAYSTRVGSGPFPTELDNDEGERIRKIGGEFGTTTGRPRRCGWLDLVAARYSVMISGTTSVALTKLDVLNSWTTLKVCTHYRVNGKMSDRFPTLFNPGTEIEPVYEEVPGWNSDISKTDHFNGLPKAAQNYVKFIESHLRVPVSFVSNGRRRTELILR